MLYNIISGIRDVWKSKLLSIFYVLFLSCIMFITVSTTEAIFRNLKWQKEQENDCFVAFENFVIGKTIENPENLLEKLSDLYVKDSYSSTFCALETKEWGRMDAYIIWGDSEQAYPYLKTEKDMGVFVGKNIAEIKEVSLNGKFYPVDKVINQSFKFKQKNSYIASYTDDLIFIVIKKPILSNWIDIKNEEVIYELIEYTHILENEKEKIEAFLNYTNSSFLEVKVMEKGKDEETDFIVKRIYPFLFCLMVSCLLSTWIILDGILKKRTREFTIHLLCGARMYYVISRLISFFVLIIIMAVGFCKLLGLIRGVELLFYIAVGVGMASMFGIIVIKKVRKKNLDLNLE